MVPKFDFEKQRRSDHQTLLHCKPGELVVLEGIHALNPEVVGPPIHAFSTGVYVSARTRIKDPNGYILHPSKVRLMRRLLRDERTRGQSFTETVERMRSVERGERLYILPNKHHANIELDTFCFYEASIYRDALLAGLKKVDQTLLEDSGVADIVPMLQQMSSMPADGVPREALVREFIGAGLA